MYLYYFNLFPTPDRENFYSGRVFGETTSDVRVHLEDGVMTASIHLPDETYHVEVFILNTHTPFFLTNLD